MPRKKKDDILSKDPRDMTHEDMLLLCRSVSQGWLKSNPDAHSQALSQLSKIMNDKHAEDRYKVQAAKVIMDSFKHILDVTKMHEPKQEETKDTNITINFRDPEKDAEEFLDDN